MNDHDAARAMAKDWLEYNPDGSDGETAYERACGNLVRCYLEAINVDTSFLLDELVRRGWKRYDADTEWTHQRIVELRESVVLGDMILVSPVEVPRL